LITLQQIQDAHKKILPYVNYTPLVNSQYLSKNSKVKLKLENFQITGSFKLRGAVNKLLSLNAQEKKKGVIAVSTGNHGKGVAYASKVLGIQSTIYMSSMVPKYRKEAIENLGAKVEIVGKNSDEADIFAKQLSKEKNITLIHPFDDEDIIIGQGTVGLEMLKEFPEVDTVIIPTSGGGLISGIAQAIKLQKPNTKIIAVSMERGPSMYESLQKGEPVDVDEVKL
jgi:Threonine dehydratase